SNNMNSLDQFKSAGVIIVNSKSKLGENFSGLQGLASDGFYYADTSYMIALQNFCKANCFCKMGSDVYPGTDPAMAAAGGCYKATGVGSAFSKAKSTCADDGGYIATVHDDAKGRFVRQLMSRTSTKSDYYWIGYEKSEFGVWEWEDEVRVGRGQKSADSYTNWDHDEPSTASVAKCTYVDTTKSRLPWAAGTCMVGFPYVCESAPCSTG
ncbi:hypothetical protein PENTCL1PPCAC_10550, partial [Pristionchus entomophagus]